MEPDVVCAILAAGRSSRMGRSKATLTVAGRTLLERAFAAVAGYKTVIVASGRVAETAATLADANRTHDFAIVRNDAPELGMSHSLALANAAIGARDAALVVLLVDTPFVDSGVVRRVIDARGDADVAYPVRAGIPGHPVVFGPRARAAIGALPPGDTLRALRDDARWRRVTLEWSGDEPFLDIDTPDDYAAVDEQS